VYSLITTLYTTGWYSYYITVDDGSGYYSDINSSPFPIHVNSSYPSHDNSRALGSGVTRAIAGRTEQIYLQVNDIHGNKYSSDYYGGTYVY
jgi:hypothetical protein